MAKTIVHAEVGEVFADPALISLAWRIDSHPDYHGSSRWGLTIVGGGAVMSVWFTSDEQREDAIIALGLKKEIG